MFSVFQATTPSPPSSDTPPSNNARKGPRTRIFKVSHACIECKRRKIRCDGDYPCGRCVGRKLGPSCCYSSRRERIHPSKQNFDQLAKAVEEYRTVFERLYPNHRVSQLLSLSREDLLGALGSTKPDYFPQSSPEISHWISPSPVSMTYYAGEPCFDPISTIGFESVDISVQWMNEEDIVASTMY